MDFKGDPYKILDLPQNSTEKEIRDRYRQLSKKYHPDKQHGEVDQFLIIEKAYKLLVHPDPSKRFKVQRGFSELKDGFNSESKIDEDALKGDAPETIDKKMLKVDEKYDPELIKKLESNRELEVFNIPQVFNEYSHSLFNQLFDANKKKKSAVVKYDRVIKQSTKSSLIKKLASADYTVYINEHNENPDPSKIDLNRYTEDKTVGVVNSINQELFNMKAAKKEKEFNDVLNNETFVKTKKTFFDLN